MPKEEASKLTTARGYLPMCLELALNTRVCVLRVDLAHVLTDVVRHHGGVEGEGLRVWGLESSGWDLAHARIDVVEAQGGKGKGGGPGPALCQASIEAACLHGCMLWYDSRQLQAGRQAARVPDSLPAMPASCAALPSARAPLLHVGWGVQVLPKLQQLVPGFRQDLLLYNFG